MLLTGMCRRKDIWEINTCRVQVGTRRNNLEDEMVSMAWMTSMTSVASVAFVGLMVKFYGVLKHCRLKQPRVKT